MSTVFLSALPLAAFQANFFLLLTAFLSFYLVFSGFRFARHKSGDPRIRDWIAVGVVVLSGMGMRGLAYFLLKGENNQ